ncbi:MAG: bifunctional [glutamate--ammonia ligase]-adenylyl-L-tyrosine phosphorylase/[glutamate--ammonia-ligase] adenylyltransferase [Rugosibacter sp.]|nr:bifunctional [glutamate--ammonia ligase]-adenylyl-L-tyrosine phosphorylase/[glutamate--ammonia-ligase] adenylyltransferase [Rugosibacter sp.]
MPLPPDIFETSRYLRRLFAARPELAEEAMARLEQPVRGDELAAWLDAQPVTEDNLKSVLRRIKQRAYARIATRDLTGRAPLAEVVETMTQIAELAVSTAQRVLTAALIARYGTPRGADGRAQELIVIGMGKLGGRELNVSSDIDLIFVYPEEGDTDGIGKRSISNFEFFTRLGRNLINAIAEITEDGQVFRVDMRLRPDGDSGPLACSFDMLENYLISQGREWERYAWIKARPLTGVRWDELEVIRRPFVFRKYLDFGAINAMRELHAQVRREVAKKAMADNVKLGPGGIREIEFLAQVFQLIRGGRDVALQAKPTLTALNLLAERGTISGEAARGLAAAYDFLRRVEHRLQYLDDAQTHTLPASAEDLKRVARAMEYVDAAAFMAALDAHRRIVAAHFEQVFADGEAADHTLDALWSEAADTGAEARERIVARLAAMGYREPQEAAERLVALRTSVRYRQMAEDIRRRLDALMPRLVETAARQPDADLTLARSIELLDAISRRGAYLALLQENPRTLEKVAQLVASSRWAANYLQRHPLLLDELLDSRLLDAAPDWAAFRSQLQALLDALEPDTERQMDVLREQHHAQVFRLLAQDVAGMLTVEKLADHLSGLADILLAVALLCAWRKFLQRHTETPHLAIISYGKLGGKELGYASDLDLVFLYDDAAPEAGENYARFGSRLNTWLSATTSAGQLFETDLRLRPNGESGLVVSSIESFRKYQFEAAWTWEHQALTRARFSAGDAAVGAAFERIRCEVLRQPRDLAQLRDEIRAMRQKMADAHATPVAQRTEVFDLKHDPGGLVDVEFTVQYLVLGFSCRHAELTGNLGNIALLGMAADLDLIPPPLAAPAAAAYREFRRQQHALRLNDAKARVAPASVAPHIAAVQKLWRHVFDT